VCFMHSTFVMRPLSHVQAMVQFPEQHDWTEYFILGSYRMPHQY
jgi:hypothetical protein